MPFQVRFGLERLAFVFFPALAFRGFTLNPKLNEPTRCFAMTSPCVRKTAAALASHKAFANRPSKPAANNTDETAAAR
jgi:hypothetical protein